MRSSSRQRRPFAHPLRALLLAIIPSLCVHLACVVAVTLSLRRPHQTRIVLPIDLLEVKGGHPEATPAKRSQPQRPALPAPSAPLLATRRPSRPRPLPRPVPSAPPASIPARDDSSLASDLGQMAPSSARLVVLLRADRIRRTAYRDSVEKLLEALPDYWSLLGSTGTGALDAFDTILIATANPLDVDQTFLAARYHGSAEDARALLDRGERGTIRWTTYRNVPIGHRPPGLFADPRVLLAPLPGLLVLTRPEFVDGLLDGLAERTSSSRPAAPASAPATWVDRLEALEAASGGASPNGPLALVTAVDVPALLDLADDGEVPTSISIGLRDPNAPSSAPGSSGGELLGTPLAPLDPIDLEVLLAFHLPDDASAFASSGWPTLRAAILAQPLAGYIAEDLRQLEPRVNGVHVTMHAEVPGARASLLLLLVRNALPRPPNAPLAGPAPLR